MAPKNIRDGFKVVLSFSISLEQAVKLKALAEKRKTTVQQLIRDFIDQETT